MAAEVDADMLDIREALESKRAELTAARLSRLKMESEAAESTKALVETQSLQERLDRKSRELQSIKASKEGDQQTLDKMNVNLSRARNKRMRAELEQVESQLEEEGKMRDDLQHSIKSIRSQHRKEVDAYLALKSASSASASASSASASASSASASASPTTAAAVAADLSDSHEEPAKPRHPPKKTTSAKRRRVGGRHVRVPSGASKGTSGIGRRGSQTVKSSSLLAEWQAVRANCEDKITQGVFASFERFARHMKEPYSTMRLWRVNQGISAERLQEITSKVRDRLAKYDDTHESKEE